MPHPKSTDMSVVPLPVNLNPQMSFQTLEKPHAACFSPHLFRSLLLTLPRALALSAEDHPRDLLPSAGGGMPRHDRNGERQ